MIRNSQLEGFDIPRTNANLKARLFADDTTTFLAEGDDFAILQVILDTWCRAAKAKFNISKTEIIPIGTKEFRKTVIETYQVHGTWNNCPRNVHVADEGEPVRILGGFFGNGLEQGTIWSPKLAKLEESLQRWRMVNPTLEGRKHVLQMMAGGMTQYLTDVQRMPKDVTKRLIRIIRNFLWNDRVHCPTRPKLARSGPSSLNTYLP
ncbi:uncharacterized protein BXZ73DRAFT_89227 [Epithele typhae]|uniref:uncharacterized protein n=1 Tax=Epithele typhae TaxID=378194 RepID=UPI0020080196|nr:uncharacterized protein BXZ73DRAFT_89227 [Epithele typhae]KAH9937789.1 hypothetical protein BXZ73DRAFT_89227 [Epithele typhae]